MTRLYALSALAPAGTTPNNRAITNDFITKLRAEASQSMAWYASGLSYGECAIYALTYIEDRDATGIDLIVNPSFRYIRHSRVGLSVYFTILLAGQKAVGVTQVIPPNAI